MRPGHRLVFSLIVALFCYGLSPVAAQSCTTLGQTPTTAFPVCGTTTFQQNNVPICSTNDLFVPGCDDGALYANKNPFWYKFHCYVSGTLGFVINPTNPNDDYDWQLYDVTGLDPNQVFTNRNIIVTANWAGTYGPTGASTAGVNFIQCASNPAANAPTFAQMPNLIAGHDYILLVSHFTDSQSGYGLSFGGGTAVITDPLAPHLKEADPDCDGTVITIKLNKDMRCNSLSGSEFSLLPAAATVTSVSAPACNTGFDLQELTITLSNPLPPGSYQLVINNGSDGNTLLDNCGNAIPQGEHIDFQYTVPQPIFADSVGTPGCAPREVKVYFPKKIICSTVAADGSDFVVTGPSAVTVTGIQADCTNGETNMVTVRFSGPIYVGGLYTLTLKAGVDGSTIVDECGLHLPVHSRTFTTADTVSAAFTYSSALDCRKNTLVFSHDGAHQVNSWNWSFNNSPISTTRQFTTQVSASSTSTVTLAVSNGVCTDQVTRRIVMDNEVIASFTIPDIICPEDALTITNTSTGLIDNWRWSFEPTGSSTVRDPAPFRFPQINREAYYNVKLVATNNTLGCSDSMRKKVRVLSNCFIAVPTAFTPNGDGLNDYLYPNDAFKADNLEFSVYNRWGQQVFHTRDWTRKWDGRVNGVMQSSGVYVWYLSYTHRDTGEKVFQKGTTTLIR
ncbi:MAG: gliding motility-associated C-terminal domain-containing protein [Chitinophagaceae bacterium]|nr:gliding motility-associated C-terminal domain-containing protein [Chitinophagaceae bacterium]